MTGHFDPDAIEIGRLYREAGGVTVTRYFSAKTSQCRNAVSPDACHWCREPFAPGQVRYPILDDVQFGSGWGLVCLCATCFDPAKDEGNITECMGGNLGRFVRRCEGCGEPVLTPVVGPFRWQVCSNRCRQRFYRKRRRGQDSVVAWKAATHRCKACKKIFSPPRKDARFCSNACRQWLYRRRKTFA